MKRLGFFGHSNCAFRAPTSHLDLLATHLNGEIVNTGVRQGSEERILHELKKAKNLDLAVIFHCEAQYQYLPGCDRDIGVNHLREHRAEYLFSNWDSPYFQEHHSKFLEKFGNATNFMNAIEAYKTYFYTPEIQLNRFYGALIQIDQYCTAKNIPVIHIVDTFIPTWFKFTSGIVDHTIVDIIKTHTHAPNTKSFNCVTDLGNQLIFERLTELVEELNPPSPAGIV